MPADCPPSLKAIINRMLALQPEHRYRSAVAIAADLERFLHGAAPDAMAIYDTPATTPVARAPVGVQPTVPYTPPRPPMTPAPGVVPSTEPPPTAAHADPKPTGPVVAPRRPPRRLGSVMVMLLGLLVLTTEGVALPFAERFRDSIATIDERTVGERREAYRAVDRSAFFDMGLRVRVHPRLRPALVAVGDRVIADYRREEPGMGPAEWRQAREALDWALQLSPHNGSLRSKWLTADGHVTRFEAQASTRGDRPILLSQAALAAFRQAAEADPRSFDPYLGMARVYGYLLADVDAAAAAIADAERRGYKSGRRESALLGDGYLARAQASRRRARVLTGEQRWRELNQARADYERCIVFFDPIVSFGNAAQNLEVCKTQLARLESQLNGRAGEP
jgi:hypothetical protein